MSAEMQSGGAGREEAVEALEALDEAQRAFAHDKRIDRRLTPREWLRFFDGVVRFDERADAYLERSGCLIAFGWLVAIGLLLVAYATWDSGAPWAVPALSGAGGGGLLAWLVYVGRQRERLKQAELRNDLRLFVVPLLRVLARDVEPGGRVRLALDLTRRLKPERQAGPTTAATDGWPKVWTTFYEIPWLQGEAPLAGGATLRFSITDFVRHRKVKKRNPRGKIKQKNKYKLKRAMDVHLTLPTDTWEIRAPGGGGVRVRTGAKRHQIRARGVVTQRSLTDAMPLHPFLARIGAAFAPVRLKRPVHARLRAKEMT